MEIDAKAVGRRLHAAIDLSKKNREEVARAAGVSVGTVQKWQSASQEPGAFALAKAAAFLGLGVDALLGVDQERSSLLDREAPPKQAIAAGIELLRLAPIERRAIMLIVRSLVEGRALQAESGNPPSRGSRRKP